ncbi:MAG: hypothetical protein AB8B91_08665 [Rubripirellula sp.]
MMRLLFCLAVALLIPTLGVAADAPGNSELVVDDGFDREELGRGWNSTTGQWKLVEGVLKGSELEEEKHSAATRRVLVTENAVYQMRFRFVGEGESFHFGFDPLRGKLKKRGHLFSVIVTPGSWKILKHIDKDRPKEDPNETLVEAKTEFTNEQWYTLRVTTWETHVTASIEGKEPLKTSHPTFAIGKPTLVFRCLGDGVEIDDLKVWKQLP